MSNDVFANGFEIVCKKASGKSICSLPDVVWTPPDKVPPTPTGVPVPYPNTAMASDTSKGSKKVKISDKEVMLKNKSCLKKSMGNEAGVAQLKGFVTMKNTGKAYFVKWSMNVKIEGENVVRHFDLTTHNHGSMPGNTPPWLYLDTMGIQVNNQHDPCKSSRNEVKEKCEKHQEKNTYSGGKRDGEVNKTGLRRDMCNDKQCRDAMKCVLVPYDQGCCTSKNSNVKTNKTPHHAIPAHCFMPPGERESGGSERYEGCANYDPDKAPCICVSGKDKSNKRLQHARLHKLVDAVEDEYKEEGGVWTYKQAENAAVDSISTVMKCDEECTRAQLNKYHNKDSKIPKNANLRADSTGTSTPSPTLTLDTGSGSLG